MFLLLVKFIAVYRSQIILSPLNCRRILLCHSFIFVYSFVFCFCFLFFYVFLKRVLRVWRIVVTNNWVLWRIVVTTILLGLTSCLVRPSEMSVLGLAVPPRSILTVGHSGGHLIRGPLPRHVGIYAGINAFWGSPHGFPMSMSPIHVSSFLF